VHWLHHGHRMQDGHMLWPHRALRSPLCTPTACSPPIGGHNGELSTAPITSTPWCAHGCTTHPPTIRPLYASSGHGLNGSCRPCIQSFSQGGKARGRDRWADYCQAGSLDGRPSPPIPYCSTQHLTRPTPLRLLSPELGTQQRLSTAERWDVEPTSVCCTQRTLSPICNAHTPYVTPVTPPPCDLRNVSATSATVDGTVAATLHAGPRPPQRADCILRLL
jgi:hypothetical protein